jgi:hypothetical protein
MDKTLHGTGASNFTGTAGQLKRNVANSLSQIKALYGAPLKDSAALDEARDMLVKLNKLTIKFDQELELLAAQEN